MFVCASVGGMFVCASVGGMFVCSSVGAMFVCASVGGMFVCARSAREQLLAADFSTCVKLLQVGLACAVLIYNYIHRFLILLSKQFKQCQIFR